MNNQPLHLEIAEPFFTALQSLYADVQELQVRAEAAQEKHQLAAKSCMITAAAVIKAAGHDPETFGNLSLEKHADGKHVLVLQPKQQ